MTQPTNPDENAGRSARRSRRIRARQVAFALAALALLVVAGAAGTGLACWLRPPDVSESKDDAKTAGPLAPYFHGWEKPDLVLVVTAEQHGYLLPCGCSKPQVGGLERRYNLIQMLKDRGWPTAAVDLGNVPQVEAPAGLPNKQGLIKYRYAMRAMKEMGYIGVGLGAFEASMPLLNALAEYPLNDPKPRVASADLMDPQNYGNATKSWQQAEPIPGVDVKVGVTAVLGPSVYEQIKKKDPSAKFTESGPALKAVLKDMETAKIDLPVLLYMGSLTQGRAGMQPEAVACAEEFPQFPLIVALDDTDLARSAPVWVQDPKTKAKTMLVSLGHKGKAVGVVGVYRTGKPGRPYDLRYQLVEMTEDFATPPAQEKTNAILKLMEEYTKELKDEKYLSKYPQVKHPNQAGKGPMPTYVGTKACIHCHVAAGKVWEHSKHSHAYQTLVAKKGPSNRQYDPECIVCHTVGFGYQTGFTSDEATKNLENVGCESCHGPGSEHAKDPTDLALRADVNPWKAPAGETADQKTRRLRRIDDYCQKCHDQENDVNWTGGGFERNWPQIEHPTPPDEKLQAGPDKEDNK